MVAMAKMLMHIVEEQGVNTVEVLAFRRDLGDSPTTVVRVAI